MSDHLIITSDTTPNEIIDSLSQNTSIVKLDLIDASLNSEALKALIDFLKKDQLTDLKLNFTKCVKSEWKKLLEIISQLRKLKHVFFENCLLPAGLETELSHVLKLSSLETIHLKGNKLISPQKIEEAVLRSLSLTKVTGIVFSNTTVKVHLDANTEIKEMNAFIKTVSSDIENDKLDEIKINFYKKHQALSKTNISHKERLNKLLFEFYHVMGKCYQEKGNPDEALKYLERSEKFHRADGALYSDLASLHFDKAFGDAKSVSAMKPEEITPEKLTHFLKSVEYAVASDKLITTPSDDSQGLTPYVAKSSLSAYFKMIAAAILVKKAEQLKSESGSEKTYQFKL